MPGDAVAQTELWGSGWRTTNSSDGGIGGREAQKSKEKGYSLFLLGRIVVFGQRDELLLLVLLSLAARHCGW